MNLPATKTAFSKINNLFYKSYLPNIIYSAIEVGVFDVLSNQALSCIDLSKEIETNEPITESLLEVLLAIEFLKEKDKRYSLTALANEYLTQTSELNQLGAVKSYIVNGGPFKNLTQALKGDIPEFDQNIWSTEKSIRGIEQGAKAGGIQRVLAFAKEIPEFKKATKMCDFAGNSGYYSFALMHENRKLHAHVYDLEIVCETANKIKKDEAGFDRISYHAFDVRAGDDFGSGYDLFFSSHYLYELGATNRLIDLLKKVNRSMKLGGLFISNHIAGKVNGDHRLTLAIVELMTRSMGFPTHCLPEKVLRKALSEAGFGKFRVKAPDERLASPTMLLSAIKIKEL
ncbi:MAG: hypothetical protein COC06_03515 [Bacteroidales bacterium]|nr:MAG: hypothetical protein COC06_03515 [Bacteroidales bacterium]